MLMTMSLRFGDLGGFLLPAECARAPTCDRNSIRFYHRIAQEELLGSLEGISLLLSLYIDVQLKNIPTLSRDGSSLRRDCDHMDIHSVLEKSRRGTELRATQTNASHSARVARLPLVVRTAADVECLLANSREVRRLPKEGIKAAIDGLDSLQADKLRASTVAYIQACGCAAGGTVAMIALLTVLISIGFEIARRGPRWTDIGETLAGVIGAVLMGGIGKMFGIFLARRGFERNCRDVIRVLSER